MTGAPPPAAHGAPGRWGAVLVLTGTMTTGGAFSSTDAMLEGWGMSVAGLAGLVLAFVGCVVSFACSAVALALRTRHGNGYASAPARVGRVAALVSLAALTLCCGLLVWCFMTGDVTLDYVVRNRSSAEGALGWLFKLSGLWAGRAGSLLFWAWLIALFGAVVACATRRGRLALDNAALAVVELVLAAFVGVCLFSGENMPFEPLPSRYLDAGGALTAEAATLGMNALLEHWAMAVHPPTLFLGYAGLTVPFAYALAALLANDDTSLWVERSTPYLMVSWLFLGIGIGLGAVWAYVVLGWGGYWGWDPVENASLLPWLMCVALVHSFTVYRKHGAFKRWSVMCACLAFSSVVLGTFITRSGIVESVHAFEGDAVSLVLFLVLIVLAPAAGALGLLVRRDGFGLERPADGDLSSLASRQAAYYVGNLVLMVCVAVLAYLTVASALPSALPLGGQALSADTYNAVARPLGIAYCALLAACPLFGWRTTSPRELARRALVPGACALLVFALLAAYFATTLLPAYDAAVAAGGAQAASLAAQGPSWYYNGLALLGFAVAALLLFNALSMVVRGVSLRGVSLRRRLPVLGGGIAHAAVAVILVGLIGSSMYVTEAVETVAYDKGTDTAGTLAVGGYELVYTGNSVDQTDAGVDVTLAFDVYREGTCVGQVTPALRLVRATQQQTLEASVLSFATEDVFVAYRGMSLDGGLVVDVRVNPLIGLVWAGFALLMVGTALSALARRQPAGGRRAQVGGS